MTWFALAGAARCSVASAFLIQMHDPKLGAEPTIDDGAASTSKIWRCRLSLWQATARGGDRRSVTPENG
jgi:hypothetical protein